MEHSYAKSYESNTNQNLSKNSASTDKFKTVNKKQNHSGKISDLCGDLHRKQNMSERDPDTDEFKTNMNNKLTKRKMKPNKVVKNKQKRVDKIFDAGGNISNSGSIDYVVNENHRSIFDGNVLRSFRYCIADYTLAAATISYSIFNLVEK